MTADRVVAHERRVLRRLDGRGEFGLGEALVRLDGCVAGGRWRLERLYAVGSEGAVFLARDLADACAPMRVAKVALLPLHRPFDLTDEEIARRRASLREEAANLAAASSPYMPRSLGLHEFVNPVLDADWGGEFAAPEPVLVMEKVPGFDLDLWLARMHSSDVPQRLLRRQLDHVAVVVLSGLMDLHERGFFYADLRPGNVRIRGRSRERVRLLDAGSLVRVDDRSGRYPHVPAYLPPALFAATLRGAPILPSAPAQAVMAGRTLYEVATGRVPMPGQPVHEESLRTHNVSPAVGETIARLCRGEFADVTSALAFLSERLAPEEPRSPHPGSPAPARRAPGRATAPCTDLHSMLARLRGGTGPVPSAAPAVPSAVASADATTATAVADRATAAPEATVAPPQTARPQTARAALPAARPSPAEARPREDEDAILPALRTREGVVSRLVRWLRRS
jgi:serine/threonine protein kinase